MSAFTNGFKFGFLTQMCHNTFGFAPFGGFGCGGYPAFGGFGCCFGANPFNFVPNPQISVFNSYPAVQMNSVMPAVPSLNMPQINTQNLDLTQTVQSSGFNFNMPLIDTRNMKFDQQIPFGDTFTRTTQSSSSSSSSSSNSSSRRTTARSYANMSDAEMRNVYGNYTKDITKPYTGTVENLNKYLKNRGVLAGKGQAFMNAQQKYGISASVLAAICIQETGGKSSNAVKLNNVGNLAKGSGWQKFASVEACIDEMARMLKENYANQGLRTLYQVNAKYCPVQDTRGSYESQSAWASCIDSISGKIERA